MMKSVQIAVLTVAACSLCSCNTFIGMGEDIQSLGSGMVNTGHGRPWSSGQAPAAPSKPATQAPPASSAR